MKYVNDKNYDLDIAMMLVNDDYKYQTIPNYFSTTTFNNPDRILCYMKSELPKADKSDVVNLSGRIASVFGTAAHSAMEHAWINNYKENLRKLGLPNNKINTVRINPDPENINHNNINIWIEARFFRKLGKYTIGGSPDIVRNYQIRDLKNTSVWKILKPDPKDYILQGSINRWILSQYFPCKDTVKIHFKFTDWNKRDAENKPLEYPQNSMISVEYPLMSLEETEEYIINKINMIENHTNTPFDNLPLCSDSDRWGSDPVVKVYPSIEKQTRAMNGGVFEGKDALRLAKNFSSKKPKSYVKVIPVEFRKCCEDYCSMYHDCNQRKQDKK